MPSHSVVDCSLMPKSGHLTVWIRDRLRDPRASAHDLAGRIAAYNFR